MARTPWQGVREFWGAITPWTTRAEREAGIAGNWGSGAYRPTYGDDGRITGRSEAEGLWDQYWANGAQPGAGTEDWYQEQMDEAEAAAGERFGGIYDQIGQLGERAAEIPSFTEWLESRGQSLGSYEDTQSQIQDLINQLQAGPTDEDRQAALDQAAQMMGMTGDELYDTMRSLSEQAYGNFTDQPGMSPEQMALAQRQNRAQIREAEQRMTRLVQDTFAETGSTARMLQHASEANQQINDYALAQDMALMQQNAEMQIAQLESKKQTWQTMLQAQQISMAEYMDNMHEGASQALQALALEAQTIQQQNADIFQTYSADMQSSIAQIDAIYKAIQLEIGATAAELESINTLYEQSVQPYLDALMAKYTQAEATYGFGDFLGDALPVIGTIAVGVLGNVDWSFPRDGIDINY